MFVGSRVGDGVLVAGLPVPVVDQPRVRRPEHLQSVTQSFVQQVNVLLPPAPHAEVEASGLSVVRCVKTHHAVGIVRPVALVPSQQHGAVTTVIFVYEFLVVELEEHGEIHLLALDRVQPTPRKEIRGDVQIHVHKE